MEMFKTDPMIRYLPNVLIEPDFKIHLKLCKNQCVHKTWFRTNSKHLSRNRLDAPSEHLNSYPHIFSYFYFTNIIYVVILIK